MNKKYIIVFLLLTISLSANLYLFNNYKNKIEKLHVYIEEKEDGLLAEIKELDDQIKYFDFYVLELEERLIETEQKLNMYEDVAEETGLEISLIVEIYNQAIEPEIVLGVIDRESKFNSNAINHNTNGSVDRGLMQINSGTAPWLWSIVFSNEPYNYKKLFNPEKNIQLGIWYLNYLLEKYNNEHMALTAYNRGEGGMRSYVNRHGTAKSSYSRYILEKWGDF